MCSILQIPFIVSTRTAFEFALANKCKDRLTPSRLAAFLHGLIATYYIFTGQWHESIHATAQFFLLDLFLHYVFSTKLSKEMIFHHLGGAALCIYSVNYGSYKENHMAEHLTKALILMETTNPVLQLLVTLRNENLQNYVQDQLLYGLKFFFFFHFTYVRVLVLAKSLLKTYEYMPQANSLEIFMFYISFIMWLLQLFWLGKIVQTVRSV